MEKKNNILEHIKIKDQKGPDAAYFTDFKQKMLQEITKDKKVKVFQLKPYFWYGISAASILILATILYFNSSEEIKILPMQNAKVEEGKVKENEPEKTKESIPNLLIPEKSKNNNIQIATNQISKSSEELFAELTLEDLNNYFENEDFDLDELEL